MKVNTCSAFSTLLSLLLHCPPNLWFIPYLGSPSSQCSSFVKKYVFLLSISYIVIIPYLFKELFTLSVLFFPSPSTLFSLISLTFALSQQPIDCSQSSYSNLSSHFCSLTIKSKIYFLTEFATASFKSIYNSILFFF